MDLDNHMLQLSTWHTTCWTQAPAQISWAGDGLHESRILQVFPSAGFALILISCWLCKERVVKAQWATYAQVHATCAPVIIDSYPGLPTKAFEILCLFLLYPRRNKPEISTVIFSYFVNTLPNIWKYLTIII